MYMDLYVKRPFFLSDFNGTWILWTVFGKSRQISNFMKILPLEAELFHVDEKTESYKGNSSF